jgi:hypothetical protein
VSTPTPDHAQTVHLMAASLAASHVAGPDGWCVACRTPRQFHPCDVVRIAAAGLTLAARMSGGEQWRCDPATS